MPKEVTLKICRREGDKLVCTKDALKMKFEKGTCGPVYMVYYGQEIKPE